MSYEICDRLYAIQNIASNPLLTQSQELYRRAIDSYTKGFFEEALEDIQASVEKNKTDYISWFLMGKIFAFGAGEFSNIIDLEKAINAFTQAAKYNSPYTGESDDARFLAAEIYFYLGAAQYSQSNELLRTDKKTEAAEMLDKALKSFEKSLQYSDKMLESLFNIARCKVLQGQKKPALNDLEKLFLLDRNYCLKLFDDYDFLEIRDESLDLINNLKQKLFIEANVNYKTAVSLVTELKTLNGPSQLYSIPPQFMDNLPYFDVMDYNDAFKRMIPQLKDAIQDITEKERRERQERIDRQERMEQARIEQKHRDEQERTENERRRKERIHQEKTERRRRFALVFQIIAIIFIFVGNGIGEGSAGKSFGYGILTIIPFLALFFLDKYSKILRVASFGISIIWFIILFKNLVSDIMKYSDYFMDKGVFVPIVAAFVLGALILLSSYITVFIAPKE
jgi:tetratricopeptide (TPR) repeat protein